MGLEELGQAVTAARAREWLQKRQFLWLGQLVAEGAGRWCSPRLRAKRVISECHRRFRWWDEASLGKAQSWSAVRAAGQGSGSLQFQMLPGLI